MHKSSISFSGPKNREEKRNSIRRRAKSTVINFESVAMEPTHNDVLSGRGVSTNNYPGNENFRKIINELTVSKYADLMVV